MPEEFKIGCARPVNDDFKDKSLSTIKQEYVRKDDVRTMLRVGKEAPNFTTSAFHKGKFTKVSLSDFKGKWVLLCFYPGDFTFV